MWQRQDYMCRSLLKELARGVVDQSFMSTEAELRRDGRTLLSPFQLQTHLACQNWRPSADYLTEGLDHYHRVTLNNSCTTKDLAMLLLAEVNAPVACLFN